jgi:hypothetical protein
MKNLLPENYKVRLHRVLREETTEKHAFDFVCEANETGRTGADIRRMNVATFYHFIDNAVKNQDDDFKERVLYAAGEAENEWHYLFSVIREHVASLVDENQALEQEWQKAERKEEEKQAAYERIREEAIIASMWVHAHAA